MWIWPGSSLSTVPTQPDQDNDGSTLLHRGFFWGMDVDPHLIGHGVDAAAQDKPRTTPLYRASIQGHVDVARWRRAAAQDKYGRTPLHRASFCGHVDVAPPSSNTAPTRRPRTSARRLRCVDVLPEACGCGPAHRARHRRGGPGQVRNDPAALGIRTGSSRYGNRARRREATMG